MITSSLGIFNAIFQFGVQQEIDQITLLYRPLDQFIRKNL